MYYLNDQHSRYEYGIYRRNNNGTPFMDGRTFNDLESVIRALSEEIKHKERYHYNYYIDNDFWKNTSMIIGGKGFYYKILRRRVNDWEEFTTKQSDKILYGNFGK